ncbi:MAG: arylesterase [Oleiphilaceae bacterium]|nr:arylesterase [Oleiphilaceae bacterium]
MPINTVIASVRSTVFLTLLALSAATWGSSGTVSGTILIMGDSLSAAYGVETERAWVARLDERLDKRGWQSWQVKNASISGETTDGGVRRLPDLLERHEPEIVVIELGGNDGLRGFPPSVIKDNLADMIQHSKQAGAQVLLVGMQIPPNYGKPYTEAFANLYADLAETYSVALVPFFLQDIYNREELMQSDGIHPTAEAQEQLLDNVWPHLKLLISTEAKSMANSSAQ